MSTDDERKKKQLRNSFSHESVMSIKHAKKKEKKNDVY